MYQSLHQNYSYYTCHRQNLRVLHCCDAYADVFSVYLIEFHILTDSVFLTTIRVTFAALKLFPDPKTTKKSFYWCEKQRELLCYIMEWLFLDEEEFID